MVTPPFCLLAKKGHANIARNLLEHGAKVDDANENGTTALMLASISGEITVVEALLQNGADIDAKDGRGWTALNHAFQKGHLHVVKYLCDHGASVDSEGNPELSQAASKGEEGAVGIADLFHEISGLKNKRFREDVLKKADKMHTQYRPENRSVNVFINNDHRQHINVENAECVAAGNININKPRHEKQNDSSDDEPKGETEARPLSPELD
ncbi:hypothetical protein RRG08_000997 [Elysia crispata]|uniref:Uncharacterized protein n=1 Tax=Elysia crispata TaxID=231223 RepID=A0AAE0XTV1_9GAST|nr:hypothetical protein RRG08_000997 [Elysia crispata]